MFLFLSVSSSGKSLVHYFFSGTVEIVGFLVLVAFGVAGWLCKLRQADAVMVSFTVKWFPWVRSRPCKYAIGVTEVQERRGWLRVM